MTLRLKTLTVAMLALVALCQAQAQGLRVPDKAPALSPVTAKPALAQADFIVAVVNSEPVTNNEVLGEAQREYQQLLQQRRAPPDIRQLLPEVLDMLRILSRSGTPAMRARGRILLKQLETSRARPARQRKAAHQNMYAEPIA